MFSVRAGNTSRAGLHPVHCASQVLSILPGIQQATNQCLWSPVDFKEPWSSENLISTLGKRPEICFVSKITAWYSPVELSKMLSRENNESSFAQPEDRKYYTGGPRSRVKIMWALKSSRLQFESCTPSSELVDFGQVWVSLNLNFPILKIHMIIIGFLGLSCPRSSLMLGGKQGFWSQIAEFRFLLWHLLAESSAANYLVFLCSCLYV